MALRVKVVSTDQREESVRTFLSCGGSKKKLYVVFELSVQVGEVEPSLQWRKYKEFAKLDETVTLHPVESY